MTQDGKGGSCLSVMASISRRQQRETGRGLTMSSARLYAETSTETDMLMSLSKERLALDIIIVICILLPVPETMLS